MLTAMAGQEFLDARDHRNRFHLSLNQEIARLFITSMTAIDFSRRASLPRQMTKWLHDFISSHKSDEITVPVASLMEWMGSENRDQHSFNQKIRRSIKDLLDCSTPLLDSKARKPWNDIGKDGLARFKRAKGQAARTWNDTPQVEAKDLADWWTFVC